MINQEWQTSSNKNVPLSLILLDIDRFKPFNDYYGHIKGDECLKTIAKTLQDLLNPYYAHICRYGGEEFAIILPNTNEEQAKYVANLIKQGIENLEIEHKGNQDSHYITISSGIATLIPNEDLIPSDLIQYADKGLYLAKDNGRNQAILYQKATA